MKVSAGFKAIKSSFGACEDAFFCKRFLVAFLSGFLGLSSLFGADNVSQGRNFNFSEMQNFSDAGNADKADQYFDAALYERAIPLYQQALRNLGETHDGKNPHADEIRYRLLQSLLLSGNYTAVIADEGDDESVQYLKALAYCKIGQYEKAAPLLERYLQSDKTQQAEYKNEACLELGKVYFQLGKYSESKAVFGGLQAERSRLGYLARLYLARVALAEEEPETAEKFLSQLAQSLPANDPLRFETAYLRGEAAFLNEDFASSAEYFEKALPENNPEITSWYPETLYHLGWSYVKLGTDTDKKVEDRLRYFEKAEATLKRLLEQSSDERTFLALGQCYLARARHLQEELAYQNAEALFSRSDLFISPEARVQAVLLLAEAAPTYAKRDTLYRHLTQDANRNTPFYAKGWYLRGLNDLEEGKSLLLSHSDEEAHKAFERAVMSLQKAFNLLQPLDAELAAVAMKYQIQALIWQESSEKYQLALEKVEGLLQNPHILMSLEDPDELYYLYALASIKLAEMKNNDTYVDKAEKALIDGLERFPEGHFAGDQLNLLGTIYYRQNQFAKAERVFVRLEDQHSETPLAGEALFWAARCADGRDDIAAAKEHRRKVFEKYPQSPYAAEAYFTYYSYRDYLQGDRAAIKHLQAMADNYPHSPFLIHACYLIGLDFKRDRKTQAGKWIRKKNMMAAIDAFQETEVAFDKLHHQGLLAGENLHYLAMIRYRAVLERALANLSVSDDSQGAKRQIYLEYAEDVLQQLVDDCRDVNHPLAQHLIGLKAPGGLEDESAYWLARAHSKANSDEDAEGILNEMIEKYRSAKITRGYFLSRTWYDKGLIALRRNDVDLALQCLQQAEDASKGNVLSTDEKLDLWIQQSLAYQAKNDLDNTILILSKVVNDDSISSLRVKAMFLRAEAYELQGRRELARKQLEATAKKGGEWAVKAKEKLDKQYGYQ